MTVGSAPPSVRAEAAKLATRVASGFLLGALTIAATIRGGAIYDMLLAAGMIASAVEWIGLIRASGGGKDDRLVAMPVGLASGALYLGVAFLSLLMLRRMGGWQLPVFLFGAVWATDTAAFAFGRVIGGPRLAPRISPNKTWAGAIGGLATAMLVGVLASGWPGVGPVTGGIMAVLVAIATQAGDLLESFIKRRCGVKDSGWIIPGHGGILDRIDGLLLAAPVFTTLCLALDLHR